MKKRHFVLVEDNQYSNYPSLIRIKEYCSSTKGKTSNQLAKILEKQGYKRLVSPTNIILHKI
jgi:hypothetical protein